MKCSPHQHFHLTICRLSQVPSEEESNADVIPEDMRAKEETEGTPSHSEYTLQNVKQRPDTVHVFNAYIQGPLCKCMSE